MIAFARPSHFGSIHFTYSQALTASLLPFLLDAVLTADAGHLSEQQRTRGSREITLTATPPTLSQQLAAGDKSSTSLVAAAAGNKSSTSSAAAAYIGLGIWFCVF